MKLLLLILVRLAFLAFVVYRCLDNFIHSEEKIKHEQWEEEKMIVP